MSKFKTNKTVLLDTKNYQTLVEFADDLALIAQRLKDDLEVTFTEDDKETTIKPRQQVKVEYKYETNANKHKFEIEIKWDEDLPTRLNIK